MRNLDVLEEIIRLLAYCICVKTNFEDILYSPRKHLDFVLSVVEIDHFLQQDYLSY